VGDCIAIIYTSPILTSLFSWPLLGEALPREFPLQVILVVAGTVLILNPSLLLPQTDTAGVEPPKDYSLVWASLLVCSLCPIVTRKTKDCSWIEVEFVNAAFAAVFLNPLLLGSQYAAFGILPEIPSTAPKEAVLIILAAMGSFLGIAMETKGYQLAEAGKASMFRYIEVPFAYVLQALGTSTPVSTDAILGSGLIIASCVLGVVGQRLGACFLGVRDRGCNQGMSKESADTDITAALQA
jgi:drug/metabolite transporter (DMT)-like permease